MLQKQKLKKQFIGLVILALVSALSPNSAHARILFVDDVFENNSEIYEIGANDDAAGTNLTLQFGGTNGETLNWDSGDSRFELSDDFGVEGTTLYLDASNTTTDNDVDIIANQGLDANGTLRYSATNDRWELNNDGNGFVGIASNLDDAYNYFGANASTITVDAAESQTGGLQFVGSLAGDETVTISNSGAGGGLLVENTGSGTSFQVNDVASDTTPFIIDTDGSVGIGLTDPTQILEVQNTGSAFNEAAYATTRVSTTGTGAAGFGPSIWLDGDSYTSGGNFILAATAGSDVSGAGNFLIYDFGAATGRFTIDAAGEIGIGGELAPAHALDITGTGEVIEIGDGSASDFIINFTDGTDRNLGWDDSEGSFSTFDNELRFRTRQSATPPVACSSTVAGMQWMDTDNGVTYSCDTSNSRNKWLSMQEFVMFGDESGTCDAGNDPNNDADCNVDWGNGLGPDGATNLGFYIPQNITLTGYGFSADNDACTSGNFDLEVWSTGSNTDDNTYTLEQTVAAALDGEAHNSNVLNIDIAGDQYTLWGLDNNCGQGIDDWNAVIYFRYRHD